jgi:AhpC/TSA family
LKILIPGSERLADATGGILAAPLASQLFACRAQSHQNRPEFAMAYDHLVVRLQALDRGEVGP